MTLKSFLLLIVGLASSFSFAALKFSVDVYEMEADGSGRFLWLARTDAGHAVRHKCHGRNGHVVLGSTVTLKCRESLDTKNYYYCSARCDCEIKKYE